MGWAPNSSSWGTVGWGDVPPELCRLVRTSGASAPQGPLLGTELVQQQLELKRSLMDRGAPSSQGPPGGLVPDQAGADTKART